MNHAFHFNMTLLAKNSENTENISIRVFFLFSFLFLWFILCFGHEAWGILLPWPRMETIPLHWKFGVLNTGPPERSLFLFVFLKEISFYFKYYTFIEKVQRSWMNECIAQIIITKEIIAKWSCVLVRSKGQTIPLNKFEVGHNQNHRSKNNRTHPRKQDKICPTCVHLCVGERYVSDKGLISRL